MGVRVGPYRRLRTEELMLSNCVAAEDSVLTENKLFKCIAMENFKYAQK